MRKSQIMPLKELEIETNIRGKRAVLNFDKKKHKRTDSHSPFFEGKKEFKRRE